jgi:hypothetical protein
MDLQYIISKKNQKIVGTIKIGFNIETGIINHIEKIKYIPVRLARLITNIKVLHFIISQNQNALLYITFL